MWDRAIFGLSLLFCSSCFSQDLMLNYQKAPIQTVIGALYGNILRKPYVLSPDLVSTSKVLTVNVSLPPDRLSNFASRLLADQGVAVVERDGVSYLSLVSSPIPGAQSAVSPALDLSGSLPAAARNDLKPQPSPQVVEDVPPITSRYVPKHRKPAFLCESVGKVFGSSACLAQDDSVYLVHPKYIKTLKEFCESLDTALPAVDLMVTFIEVSGNQRDGFGLALVSKALGASVTASIGAVSQDGAVLTVKSTNFSAVLDALRSDSRFTQVASPSGRVDSGQSFRINIGDEVPTLGGQIRDQTGLVTSPVIYRPSGVILNVTPLVLGDHQSQTSITASVDAQVSSFSPTTSGVNSSPTLSKRQVQTTLTFDPTDVVVFGGLKGSSSSNAKGSLWGMPLGWRDTAAETELVLVMSANVVHAH
jgi:type II secretory pathway component GspD/PulD (secretin)